ncbi:hypothetical protein R84981_001436 [Carnimonas sp. R-84981]|uniref:oxygenase MpaB family protein n=1 Tax=Carnimonas bestiolae TaxID=3402172 RepID=UPI003EDC4205
MNLFRKAIDRRIADLTGRRHSPVDYTTPLGDPGLFGPDSAVWRVHGDFTAMMCGGIGALLLQMLHPLALAGVWDHSTFRDDMLGRLRRTSQFIAITTYASRQQAESAIARVRAIHQQVTGTAPDGTPYRADDPDLLTWVHVAEMRSFLASYLRYRSPNCALSEQNRYYAESARVAVALGARQVPTSVSEVADYLEQMRPQLECSERTREVARILFRSGPQDMAGRRAARLFMNAGIDILPDWATQQLGFARSHMQQAVTKRSVQAVAPIIRSSVSGTARELAEKRVQATGQPASL